MKSEWVPFVKEKVEVQISERVGLTVVAARVFTREEDINTRKEVLLDNLRPWLTQKPKILEILFEGRFSKLYVLTLYSLLTFTTMAQTRTVLDERLSIEKTYSK